MLRTERTYFSLYGLYLASAWFLAPIYPLFLLDRGLDLFEINAVLAIYLVTMFVFELPTGAVADLLGRKTSFLLSCATRAVAYGLYSTADGFLDCVAAEILDGIGTTLASGSLEAWAVDGLRREGHRGPTDRFFARAQTFSRAIMIVSGIAGGYVATAGFELPWRVGAAGFVVTFVLAAVSMDDSASKRTASLGSAWRSIGTTVAEGWGDVRRSPALRWLCVLTAAGAFAFYPAHMVWQPRLSALAGEGVWMMGWIWAGLNLTTSAGSLALPWLLRRFRRSTVLALAGLWRGALFGAAAASTTFGPSVAFFLLQEAAWGFGEPVVQAWTNEEVSSERRATVLSVRSMFATLGGGLGLLLSGGLARELGTAAPWGAAAVVFLLTVPAALRLRSYGVPPEATPPVRPEPRADELTPRVMPP